VRIHSTATTVVIRIVLLALESDEALSGPLIASSACPDPALLETKEPPAPSLTVRGVAT
jgi:hypothetical protein